MIDQTHDGPAGAERAWPEPVVNIVGEKIALGPLAREHIPLHVRWVNDFHVIRTFGEAPRPHTVESVTAWFERAAGPGGGPWFTIYERASLPSLGSSGPGQAWRPVGRTDLFDVDERNGTAVFGLLIGESDARGKGYGTETARLMLDYGFTALGLRRIRLDVDEFNRAGRRAYEKAGFREIGRRREASWMGGRFWDLIYMECLAGEFRC
jgi:RimJ/RimL family protein N-acetyltransferase